MTTSADKALILDLDGVVSPIKGDTAWGDDVIAGWAFGPVPVSPTLCARLDHLAQQPDLTCLWLTSWTPKMRANTRPLPGRDWPHVPTATHDHDWWKWSDLETWLSQHPEITRLVWCDDDLAYSLLDDDEEPKSDEDLAPRKTVYERRLAEKGIEALLIAPDANTGLTPEHMQLIEHALGV